MQSGSRSRSGESPPRSMDELGRGHVLDGRYRLIERIGHGGFGDVWRAVELLPDGAALRDVALKLLAPQIDGSTWAEEAKLLASFSHPALVTIYAAGILGDLGAPFVAMELLIGETLAETLKRRGRLPWRAALRYAREVAAALDVIHARGVVHLDLKPANVFVTKSGAIKVLDFGISRGAHTLPRERTSVADPLVQTAALLASSDPYAATQIASTGDPGAASPGKIVFGTPGFVAPEVLALSDPSPSADAYALGTTLAQLITGRLPHDVSFDPPDDSDADTMRAYFVELRQATLDGKLRDLAAEGAPRGVAALVMRLCAVDPERRAEGGKLRDLLDEAWERPHGVPEDPYPGARPMTRAHEGFAFGRDPELVRIMRHLAFETMVAVSGPRGAGKTSFVVATLAPEIAKARLDDRLDFQAVFASMAGRPDDALEAALATCGAGLVAGDDGAAHPQDDLATLAGLVAGDDGGLLLVFDDFEQVLACDASARARSLALLAAALHAKKVDGLRIVLVIEQDRVEALAALSPSLAALPSVVRYLAPPPESAARDIAVTPAKLAGWTVDGADEAAAIVEAELARSAVPLPGIAIALARWAAPGHEAGRLDGRALGGAAAEQALFAHADAVVARLDQTERDLAMEVLLCLTTSDGEVVHRRPDDLIRLVGEAPDRTRGVLHALRDGFITRTQGDAVTLAHAALVRWPRLAGARLAALERLALRERLAEAAEAWERSGHRADYLDRGAVLREIDQLGPSSRAGLSAVEHEFLLASRRRRRRALAWRIAAVSAVLAVVVGAALGKRSVDERRLLAEAQRREALEKAAISDLVSRARGATDPYERIAYLAQSMRRGATDPALTIELLAAAHELAPVRFLSTEPVERPAMPWGDRWVVGIGAAGTLAVFDLEPPRSEAEVLEHVDVELDADLLRLLYRRPTEHRIGVGSAPVVDVVPLAIDTAVLARNAAGEVNLLRLRESGTIALAARAPMRCRGGLVAASRTPVAGCLSDRGVAVWDIVTDAVIEIDEAAGAIALSPDGRRIAAWTGADLMLATYPFGAASRVRAKLPADVRVAAFGPREPLLAVGLERELRILDAADPSRVVHAQPSLRDPAGVRWDDGGVDVALCKLSGQAEWYYLRKGGRAADEPRPVGRCGPVSYAPKLVQRFALGDFARRSTGTHFSKAFVLSDGRVLSTSLALAFDNDERLDRRLLFVPRGDAGRPLSPGPGETVVNVARHGDVVVIERGHVGDDIQRGEAPELWVLEARTGRRVAALRAHLLGPCPDGRILAWRAEGKHWSLREVRSGALVGEIPRAAGFILGVGPSCAKLYVQTQEGEILSHDLGAANGSAVSVARARGYVFDVEPSGAFPGGGPGLLVALSSGEVARIDERDDSMRLLGRAAPRATALADGPRPGEALFADGMGLFRVRRDGRVERLVQTSGGSPWEDAVPVMDGRAVVLASIEGLSIVDVDAGAVVASAPVRGMTRLADWTAHGSIFAYAPDVEGIPHGLLVPVGKEAVDAIGALASNLRVDEKGKLVLKD